MNRTQEPKYRIKISTDGDRSQIVNRVSGEAIPRDEPIMIFRARDKNSALMIAYYKKLCKNDEHKRVVNERLHQFVDWAHDNPERMKEPDTDTSDRAA